MNQLQMLKQAMIAYVANSVKAIWSAVTHPLTIIGKKNCDVADYKIYGNSYCGVLPIDYQQVEYIEATGKQYLEINYIASNITTTKGSFQLTDINTGLMLFGSRENNQNGGLSYALNWGGELPYKYYNTFNRSATSSLTDKEIDLDKHTFEKAKNNLYIDGELIDTVTKSTFKTPYNMIVFGCNNKGKAGYLAKAKIFTMQFYDNDELKVDLIPCYRKSDGVIGMYDSVTGTFYTNKGTDVFLKGEVLLSPDNPIEVQSVGELTVNAKDENAVGVEYKFNNLMVYTGEDDADYEPYKKYKVPIKVTCGAEEKTVNIYLDEPLRKVGDYTDYIDFKNKRIVRPLECKAFDGTEGWVIHTATDSGSVFRCEGVLSPLIGASLNDTFMTHFALTDVYSTASFENGWYRFAYTQADFTILSSRLYVSAQQETLDDFITWLSENKPVIVYPLDEPVIEDVELPTLPQFKGTTVYEAQTDVPPSGIEVQYYK